LFHGLHVQTFHVYLAGKQGPVLFCLHGGGYTGSASDLITTILQFAFGCWDDDGSECFINSQPSVFCHVLADFHLHLLQER
jgi:hypothetical protein